MYERLREFLARSGEPNVEVSSVHVLRVGCVGLLPFKHAEENETKFPVAHLREALTKHDVGVVDGEKLYADVLDALRAHPNVFHITPAGEKMKAEIEGFNNGILVDGALFRLRVGLPKRMQRYRESHIDDGAIIENFDVISTGSVFGAYSQIEQYPAYTFIAHEFREILRKQVESNSAYSARVFGPSPIHPDIYVVFVNPETARIGQVFKDGNDVIVLVDRAIPVDEAIEFVFRLIRLHTMFFYSVLVQRGALLDHLVEVLNRFAELSATVRKLHSTPWWRLTQISALIQEGKLSVGSIYDVLVALQQRFVNHDRASREVLGYVQQNRVLSHIQPYLASSMDAGVEVPQSLTSALAHFEGQLQSSTSTQVAIGASIVGAGIGAVLTGLLT